MLCVALKAEEQHRTWVTRAQKIWKPEPDGGSSSPVASSVSVIRAARAVAGEPSTDILLKNSLISGVAVEGVLSDSTRHMSGCTPTG